MRPTLQTGAQLLLLALLSCSSEMSFNGDIDSSGESDADTDTDSDADFDTGGRETEDGYLRLPPSQTDAFVFVANPDRGTLTRINANTLDVRTVPVGANPSIVITTSDYARAVAFNRGDATVSVVNAVTLDVVTVPIREDLNRMVVSPNGTWAVLWHDVDAELPDDPPPHGVQAYNEASFVNLVTATHYPLAVDKNPRNVEFTADSGAAVVVSDRSLALVSLIDDAPSQADVIPFDPGALEPPRAEEIVLGADAGFALVRQFGTSDLVVVDLLTREVDRVPVGLNPTDLDRIPGSNRAVLVSRDAHELAVFDLADPLAAPQVLSLPPDLPLGAISMTADGKRGVVFTTASPTLRYADWDVDSDEISLWPLEKPVRSVDVTPDGKSLLVFHTKGDAPDTPANFYLKDAWALSMVRLSDHLTDSWKLPAEPIGWANARSGEAGYFIMKDQPLLETINYSTRFIDELTLRSTPLFVGVLPDLDPEDGTEPLAWVSQEHRLGRLTFFNPNTEQAETITGFELNSQVE